MLYLLQRAVAFRGAGRDDLKVDCVRSLGPRRRGGHGENSTWGIRKMVWQQAAKGLRRPAYTPRPVEGGSKKFDLPPSKNLTKLFTRAVKSGIGNLP